jgi:hypothetical protein
LEASSSASPHTPQNDSSQQDYLQQHFSQLHCTDVLFAILNMPVQLIEQHVTGFSQETKALNKEVENRREAERNETFTRAFAAKENALELCDEITNKLEFLSCYSE